MSILESGQGNRDVNLLPCRASGQDMMVQAWRACHVLITHMLGEGKGENTRGGGNRPKL